MEKKDFNILIADDDEIVREVIASLLFQEGYRVVTTADGLDAIRMLRVETVHFVITDLRMPGADGIEVLRHAIRNNADTAVVILTAYGSLDTTLEAMKEGAFYYLTKPFRGQEIVLLAERAFQRAVLLCDNRELRGHLRDTFRDIETINDVARSRNGDVSVRWLERLERLKSMSLLTEQEAEILKGRLIRNDG